VTADAISAYEPWIRVGAFVAMFLAVAAWEIASPRRRFHYQRHQRWPHNLALFALDIAIVRLLAAGAVVAVAVEVETSGWGLLNVVEVPPLLSGILAFVALDLVIYGQHVLFHRVPLLWRLHRVHHTDPEFDVTTASRFHPLEILMSLGIKCVAVAALGAPPVAVLAFELVLNVAAMFNHANGRLPIGVDRWLRRVLVTPDMHRVHHSILAGETNSNFGFNLPWWDRLFGTYLDQPAAGHAAMHTGAEHFTGDDAISLPRLLLQPLRRA
jgi:sterol desaturase/sphingolipid hydroxylase (fatty acid hydroxylase superfamily)